MTCYFPTTRRRRRARTPLVIDVDPAARLLRPIGELDHATAPLLVDAVETLAERSPGEIRISLADVRFLGAAGINALVRIANAQRETGLLARIEDPSDRVARILALGNAGWLLA